jgi:collagen type VI alpha
MYIFTVIPLSKCQNALDIVFLLDGSQSVKESNFKLVKNYTVDLISKFEINPYNTRIGIVEFSTLVNPKIELGQYDNFQNLSEAIEKIQMSNFGTSTHKAIVYMRNMFKQSQRSSAIKVVVCITQVEAKRAHNENIVMFALGIGPNVFKTELRFIASKEEYVKEVSDYSALPTNLAMEICNRKFYF